MTPEIKDFTAQMMMSYRVSTLGRGAVHENRSQSEGAFVRSRLRGIGKAEGNLRRPQGEGRTAETPKKQPFAQIVGSAARDVTTSGRAVCGIFGWQAGWCTWSSSAGGYVVQGAAACM